MHSNNDYQSDLNLPLEEEQSSVTFFGKAIAAFYRLSQFAVVNRKVVIPLVLIFFTAIGVYYFLNNEPATPARRPNLTPPLTVSVQEVVSREYQVNVQSYGNVAPRTQSFLVAQVSGVVTEVSDKLREGSFFEQGDILLKVDDRDYLADIKISAANLAEAKQALSEEVAAGRQAEDDWKRLGNTEPANDLVLRKPQLQAVEARLASAEAALSKAQLGLDRTQVVAPFSGRVLNKMIDIGQVTNTNAQVAEVYATDYIEIRLPIRDTDLRFVNLPESYRGLENRQFNTSAKIYSSLADGGEPWMGQVVRTESAIDSDSRQLHVVAQIDDPYGEAAIGRSPLKIGEYVTAEIEGKKLADAVVIPSSTIYQDSYVYIVREGIVERREVEILWRGKSEALIGDGLVNGDFLVTTTLGQVASGTRVNIEGQAKPERGAFGANKSFEGKGSSEGKRPIGSKEAGGKKPNGKKPKPGGQSSQAAVQGG